MKLRNTLLGSTLLVAAFGSSALSLGRARGTVVLGQPLDLSVDVRLDQADDAVGQCFDAEVFHADSRVDGNRVQVTVQNVTSALTAVVRIRSSTIVDEPVVSVNLRSTCGQTNSRKYEFLTDFPVETRPATVPTVIPAAVTAPAPNAAPVPAPAFPAATAPATSPAEAPAAASPVPAPAPSPARAPTPAPAVVATPSPTARIAPAPRPPRPVAAPRPAPPAPPRVVRAPAVPKAAPAAAPAVPVSPQAEAPAARPRLRLDAAASADERQAVLKPSTELLSAPTDNAQQRAEATAAWRSLNQLPAADPQGEKDRQRLQVLEAEGKALRAQLAKNDEDMRLRMERLESNRFDSSLVYVLLALLAAALLAAAFFWNRARKSVAMVADWSRQNDSLMADAALAAPGGVGRGDSAAVPLAADGPAPRTAARPAPKAPTPPVAPVEDPDIDESLFQDLKKLKTVTLPQTLSPLAPAAAAAAVASAASPRHSPEDFFDVQQHADFFVSLGQYDQAIDVLKKNIDENIEVSPLAYLELLKIYHTLSRQDDYNQLRENFNRIFNGKVPPFASFHDEGRGLEDYPAALLAIENHWGTPQVLDDIESNLYRAPGASAGPAFDLAAYREFLLLYAVAKSNVRRSGSQADAAPTRPARSAPITFNAPLSTPAPLAPLAPTAPTAPQRPVPAPPLAAALSAMVLDEPVPPEPVVGDGSHTQPMLLMPDTTHPGLDTPPTRAEVPSYKQPLDLDLDLDLNLDFSNSELIDMGGGPESKPPELPMLDLPESFPPTLPPESADAPPGFPPATGLDSNLIEFDLFDPTIEAKISPKK